MKSSSLWNFLSVICFFLTVFDLRIFSVFGSAFIILILCFSIILLNFEKYYVQINNVLSYFKVFIYTYLIFLTYVFFRIIFNGGEDLSYFFTTLKATTIILATLLYLVVFGKHDLFKIIFLVFFINGLFCLFFGFFPDLKYLISPFQYPSSEFGTELIGANEYRNSFLSGSGYFGISALYSLVFPIILFYFLKNINALNFLRLFVIMIAGVLAGRVALLCYFITIIFYAFFKRKLNILFVFLLFVLLGNYILVSFSAFEAANLWISEMYKGDGIKESNTIQRLTEMFYFPSQQTLIFGDGKYKLESGGYYGGTDVGYMRNILFGGIFFTILIIFNFFTALFNLNKNMLIYIIIIISLILHFKGVFILNNPGFYPVVLTFSYYLYYSKLMEKNT